LLELKRGDLVEKKNSEVYTGMNGYTELGNDDLETRTNFTFDGYICIV